MKDARLIRVFTSVAAMVILWWPGTSCLGQESRQAVASIASRAVSEPAMHQTDHFFVVSEDESPTSPVLGALLETIHAKLREAMVSRGLVLETPNDPLLWICFDDREEYRQYALDVEHASPAFRDAFYSTRTNRVVLFSGGELARAVASVHLTAHKTQAVPGRRSSATTSRERVVMLTHEMTHQMAYNGGLQKRGVMYPLWVSEGLATYFESSALPEADRAAARTREARLAKLGSRGGLLPLEELVVLSGPGALGASPADVYAQCWGLMGFLLKHCPDELSAYLRDLRETPQGRRSSAAMRREFVTHFGSIDALDRPWQGFVASLSEPVTADDRSVAATGL